MKTFQRNINENNAYRARMCAVPGDSCPTVSVGGNACVFAKRLLVVWQA